MVKSVSNKKKYGIIERDEKTTLGQNNPRGAMDLFKEMNSFLPNFRDLFLIRYKILKLIGDSQMIGRRQIAKVLSLPERRVRNEIDILKELSLIVQRPMGLEITEFGIKKLDALLSVYNELNEMNVLAKTLEDSLGIKSVRVVSKDAVNFSIAHELISLLSVYDDMKVIGITGGSSVGLAVDSLPDKLHLGDVIIVPARGSIGTNASHLSNTIVEKFARKTGSAYYSLYTPDILSENTIEVLKKESGINEAIGMISTIDTLIFGIGRADEMARKRRLEPKYIDEVIKSGAKAEAFGYYFNDEGKIIDFVSTVGIDIDHFKRLENLIAIAYGRKKAEAIISVSKINRNMQLITDDECAREIIDHIGGKK